MKKLTKSALSAAVILCPQAALAAPVLSPNDFVIAIDADPPLSLSNSPAAESAANAHDGSTATKYLNFGELDTGIVVTPFAGSTTIQSMLLYTANDYASRDPASWKIYGTNDPYDHVANNNGTSVLPGVNWTEIGAGNVAMPGTLPGGGDGDPANTGRFEAGPLLTFPNTNAYSTYRILFPTTKAPNGVGADSMQLSEIELYSTLDGPGGSANVLSILDSSSAFQLPKPDSRYNNGERPALAIDGVGLNPNIPSRSGFPGNEGPTNVVDGTLAKYLNTAGANSGFIVTPASGASTVKSFTITSANDAVERDPLSYELYGTNSPITSPNNSFGTSEPWTLISSGALALPADRNTLGPVVAVDNNVSYASYKMLFPTIVGPSNLMQIAEASFYSSSDGSGANILNAGDPVLAIDADMTTGLQSKYLNFGENNSGLIVTPVAGAKAVTSLQITTANDAVARDPASYEIYGTNADIVSTDNSRGTGEAWTLISSGALALPEARLTEGGVVAFANATAYKSYKIIFPTVKDATAANSMQISGLQLFDSSAIADPDFNGDGVVDGQDFLVWQRGFGLTGQTNNDNGDADGNGIVNAADLTLWRTGFGGSAVAAAGAVPEPASAVLAAFVGGVATLAGRGFGKRR
jgi:hypothetical protein